MLTYPRKPSGKQAGRLLLPHWLRDGAYDCLRIEYAIGVGRPEAAVSPGEDVPDNVAALVAEAVPELSAACRRFLLGHALAPHAKWANEPVPVEAEADETPVTVADLERQLRELADAGDKGAILAMLAALDPARYGPPGRVAPDAPNQVDTVDFAPVIGK
jgi:hypothetical protein